MRAVRTARHRERSDAIHRRQSVAKTGSLHPLRGFAMTAPWFFGVCLMAALSVMSAAAAQQQGGVEDRLREAVRRTTTELRALQDAQARGQAELDEAKRQRDLLQQQLDRQLALNAELEARAAVAPALAEREAQLRQDFAALQASNDAMLQALKQWQEAYQEVAGVARAKESERLHAEAGLAETQRVLASCQEKNDKLTVVAEDTLNLYRSQDFVSLLRGSWEPVLGLQRVELENIVQDRKDRILDQRFVTPPAASGAPAASADVIAEPAR